MIVELPSPEARREILQQHAARFPEPFDFTLAGAGGRPDKLRLLLGNPAKDSEAWELAVAATFKPRTLKADEAALVAECILWPDQSTWGGIVRRWPALTTSVGTALRRKYGGALSVLEDPGFDEDPPPIVKDAQARNAAVVWRRLNLRASELDIGPVIDVAIHPPEHTVWEMFHESMAATEAKCWPLARDFALASVAASSQPIAGVFERWPGSALLVALCASTIAGLAAECEKGEF